jgi:hypothetical protein
MMEIPTGAIDAIKYYRSVNPGAGLTDSKRFYDNFMSLHHKVTWDNLTVKEVRDYMTQCREVARSQRYEAMIEMINTYNKDYSTSYNLTVHQSRLTEEPF